MPRVATHVSDEITTRNDYRAPSLIGILLVVAGGIWLGLASYRSAGRVAALGAVTDVLDAQALQAALPMVAAGFEFTLSGGGRYCDVLEHGSGFVVSPNGLVITSRGVVRGVLGVKDIANEQYTFDWYARNVVMRRQADALRGELARLEEGLKKEGFDPVESGRCTQLKASLSAIESADVEVVKRCVDSLKESYLTLEPKVWLVFQGRRSPLQGERVFVCDQAGGDVAILKCDAVFERFFQLSRSLSANSPGTVVRAYGYPAEESSAMMAFDEQIGSFIRRMVRHRSPRDFVGNSDRFTVTQGVFSRLTRIDSPDGTRLARIDHDARVQPGGSGGPLLAADATVIGVNVMSEDGRAFALSVPDMADLLGLYLPSSCWAK